MGRDAENFGEIARIADLLYRSSKYEVANALP